MPISIHTPHAGSDNMPSKKPQFVINFNPHSPCGERRAYFLINCSRFKFQSTLPMRGATATLQLSISIQNDFNPHSPCGERPGQRKDVFTPIGNFNPHSPCGERRQDVYELKEDKKFQSTLPMRGATDWCPLRDLPERFQSTLPMRGAT